MEKPRGVDEICARRPPCGMHEMSLDAALREGRPVMLTFATPAHCQPAVCGPMVDTIEVVRTSPLLVLPDQIDRLAALAV